MTLQFYFLGTLCRTNADASLIERYNGQKWSVATSGVIAQQARIHLADAKRRGILPTAREVVL